MKTLFTVAFVLAFASASVAQNYFDVTPGNGFGIRFWSHDFYKIHMGNAAEYHFGPVTDYSIKMNMSSDAGRGWTWGLMGAVPVAALSNLGEFQIANTFYGGGHAGIGTTTISNVQGYGRVLEVSHLSHSKIMATSSSQTYRVAMYSHPYWNGGGGFLGTETNHNLFFLTNYDPKAVLSAAGNFGIGTLTPTQKLDVAGIISIQGVKVVNTTGSANGGDIYINSRVIRNESTINPDGMYINYNASGGTAADVRFYADGTTERMRITASTGNVGIGTMTPDAKLAVKGLIHSQEVKVDLTGAVAPDYVFEKDYKLPTLAMVKSYVDQHHHLPEVPSAKEIETNGIELGTMNLVLLKKIEELTLHMISMSEKLDEQIRLNGEQAVELETLKKTQGNPDRK